MWNWLFGSALPPPPKTLTDYPWRSDIDWTDEFEEKLLHDIQHIDPAENPNLLLIGPVGAGKSSFINSVVSIGKGRRYSMVPTGDTQQIRSCTLDFESYTHAELLKGYNLMDSMGIEQSEGAGFHQDDLVSLLKGHIMEGYTFNPVSPISKENGHYRPKPTLSDQCHCVIFVASAKSLHSGFSRQYTDKMKSLHNKIKQERVPRVLILTKVDDLCDEVHSDIKNLFRSVKVRYSVKEASELFGIEEASIHPVKNYEADSNVRTEANIPLLLALKQTMDYASDRVEYVKKKRRRCDSESCTHKKIK